MLKRSFEPLPISTSLMSALPIRCTCCHDPELACGRGERRTVIRGREVVPQTPMVAFTDVAGSTLPVLVIIETGTSMAIAFTAYPDTKSGATFVFDASCAAVRTP